MKKLRSILIIDDESDLRNVVRNLLLKEGYKDVDEAENGEDAIELVENKLYDLIICDIRMEKMDGIQFLHNMMQRKNATWFIFLSGYLDEKAMRSGTFLSIEKPFSRANLIFTVKRVELLRSLFLEYDSILARVNSNLELIRDNTDNKKMVDEKVEEIKKLIENKSDYIYSIYFNEEVKTFNV
ncbi:MAG: response regulator [Oligoflexia bacterium]|nr:response regulator [Oligoflexia bacterium]